MTVSFTHSQTETRMNRCMQKSTAIRPDKQEFLKMQLIHILMNSLEQEL